MANDVRIVAPDQIRQVTVTNQGQSVALDVNVVNAGFTASVTVSPTMSVTATQANPVWVTGTFAATVTPPSFTSSTFILNQDQNADVSIPDGAVGASLQINVPNLAILLNGALYIGYSNSGTQVFGPATSIWDHQSGTFLQGAGPSLWTSASFPHGAAYTSGSGWFTLTDVNGWKKIRFQNTSPVPATCTINWNESPYQGVQRVSASIGNFPTGFNVQITGTSVTLPVTSTAAAPLWVTGAIGQGVISVQSGSIAGGTPQLGLTKTAPIGTQGVALITMDTSVGGVDNWQIYGRTDSSDGFHVLDLFDHYNNVVTKTVTGVGWYPVLDAAGLNEFAAWHSSSAGGTFRYKISFNNNAPTWPMIQPSGVAMVVTSTQAAPVWITGSVNANVPATQSVTWLPNLVLTASISNLPATQSVQLQGTASITGNVSAVERLPSTSIHHTWSYVTQSAASTSTFFEPWGSPWNSSASWAVSQSVSSSFFVTTTSASMGVYQGVGHVTTSTTGTWSFASSGSYIPYTMSFSTDISFRGVAAQGVSSVDGAHFQIGFLAKDNFGTTTDEAYLRFIMGTDTGPYPGIPPYMIVQAQINNMGSFLWSGSFFTANWTPAGGATYTSGVHNFSIVMCTGGLNPGDSGSIQFLMDNVELGRYSGTFPFSTASAFHISADTLAKGNGYAGPVSMSLGQISLSQSYNYAPALWSQLTMLTSSANRRKFSIYNDTNSGWLIRLGTTASQDIYTFPLWSGYYYEEAIYPYTGDVTAVPVWSSGVTPYQYVSGVMHVEEFNL